MPRLKIKRSSSIRPHPQADESKLRESIEAKLVYALGKTPQSANDYDWYQATVLAVRDRIVDIWLKTQQETTRLKKSASTTCRSNFSLGACCLIR